MYPTLGEILDMAVVAAGRPLVRAGRAALDTPVRWVHVSEQGDVSGTLSGGELILSIGVAASDPTTDLDAYLDSLREAGAVGLMIELGQHLTALPARLVQRARATSFPLVELRRTVRFVELTESVHARVLTEQYARLHFAERVAETFRDLTLGGASSATVVDEAARLLGLPVVLEDAGHRALAVAGGESEAVLRDWISRSRQASGGSVDGGAVDGGGPEGWLNVPVGRGRARWGRLVVPVRSGADDRVRTVLAHAGDALTLLALLAPDERAPARQAHDLLLADLLGAPRVPSTGLRARARALGLPVSGAFAVLALAPARGQLVAAVNAMPAAGLVGTLPGDVVGVILPIAAPDAEPEIVSSLIDAVPSALVAAVAAADAATFDGLGAALAEAVHVLDVVLGAGGPEPRSVWRSADLGLRSLVWDLRRDPRLLAFVDEQLGPILRQEAQRRAELLRSLRAFAESDGVISVFATRIGTSRPAAYARARKLSALLGRDLADPVVKLSVQVAVLGMDLAGNADPVGRDREAISFRPG